MLLAKVLKWLVVYVFRMDCGQYRAGYEGTLRDLRAGVSVKAIADYWALYHHQPTNHPSRRWYYAGMKDALDEWVLKEVS